MFSCLLCTHVPTFYYSVKDWHTFRSSSCLQVVRHLLQRGQICHAKLFWIRHQVYMYCVLVQYVYVVISVSWPTSSQVTVHQELATLDTCALAQLVPADLSTAVTWLSATILPYILAHSPHQMVCYSVLPVLLSIYCYCIERISGRARKHAVQSRIQ